MHVFGSLRPLDVRSLAGPTFDIEAKPGDELVREDVVIGTFFVIRTGTAVVSRRQIKVRTLGPGDCFGEADPASSQLQRYTIVATSRMHLLTFSSVGIGQLCAAIPGTSERIRASLAQVPLAASA
jgi:CRP-like cAMP-binding protein